MKLNQKKIIISFIWGLLAIYICSTIGLAANKEVKVKQIASFKAFAGDIKVEQDQIKLFVGLNKYIKDNGKDKLKQKYPKWQGESHLIHHYKWSAQQKKYQFVTKEVGNLSSERVEKAIEVGKKAVDIVDKPWANFLPAGMKVRAYQECDLEEDGTEEVVVFLRQEAAESLIYKPARLIILYPRGQKHEKYRVISEFRSRRYQNWASCTWLVKLKVAEINEDGVLEIMVWSVSLGGSGYTTTLDIYAPARGQKFINVNK